MMGYVQKFLETVGLTTSIGLTIRHALGALGGAMVAKGIIDGSSVEPLVGALMTLLTIGWSAVQKFETNKPPE